MAYNGTIDLAAGVRPKNNGTFALVNAPDVQVADDGERLDARLAGLETQIDEAVGGLETQINEIVVTSPVWNTISGASSFDATDTGKSGNVGNSKVTLAGNESYDSYEIYLNEGDTFCAPGTLPTYYSMCIGTGYYLDDGQPAWNASHNSITCASSVRYRTTSGGTTSGDLPTTENPFVCTDRTLLVITVTAGATPSFMLAGTTYELSSEISAKETQKAETAVREAGLIYVHKKSAWFYVFVPTENPGIYMRYAIQHYTAAAQAVDVIEIRQVDLYTGHELIGTNTDRYGDGVIFPVAVEGQWELALALDSDRGPAPSTTANFIGGKNHGYEQIISDNLWLFVDGKLVTPGTNEDYTCHEFAFMSNTKISHYQDSGNEVATHRNKTTIRTDGIEMEQALEWLVDDTAADSFICMLPMKRGNDENTDVQVTAYAYDYLIFTPYDISTTGFDNYMHDQIAGRTKMTEYGPASGIEATAEIIGTFAEGNYGYIRNDALYNKMYFSYAPSNYAVHNGDKWYWKNKYRITHREIV